jgi:ESX secretion system ATPase EccB
MANRRDQAHAYRFLMRRQTSALLDDHPDGPDVPTHRLSLAAVTSVVIAALVTGGFGIAGLISPGRSTSWRTGNALILEKGTDTRLIYSGGVLYPVLNYTSARLLLGSQTLTVDSVSSGSLSGVPRGLPVGIPGAPEEIPDPSALLTEPWSTCTYPSADASGQVRPYVRLTVGLAAPGTDLPAADSLLVAAPDGTEFLIWNDQRFRLSAAYAQAALGYAADAPLPVGAAWLDTVPQGPDLAAPAIPDEGNQIPAIGGRPTRAGQLFQVTGVGTAPQYYAAYPDGLAAITATQVDLLLGDPASQGAYPGASVALLPLDEGDASGAAKSARQPALAPGLPSTPPRLLATGGSSISVCSVFSDPTGASQDVAVRTRILSPAELAGTPAGTAPVAEQGGPTADQVVVAPEHGAVVQALPAPGVSTGTLFLVTDLGVKFPLTSADLLTSLGLGGVRPTPVPDGVLQLLPTGPRLDRGDAAETVAILPDQNGVPQSQIPIPAASGS